MKTFYLPDIISYYTAQNFLEELRSFAQPGDVVEINTSWGGDLGQGYEVAAAIRELKLNTKLNFLCASISNIIFFAGIYREVSDVAKMYFHSVSEDVENFELNQQTLQEKLEEIKLLNSQYSEVASKYINSDPTIQKIISGYIKSLVEESQWIDSTVISEKFNCTMFTLENQQKLAANLLKNFLNSQIMIGETTMQKQEEEITKQQEEITKQQEEITKQQEEITKQQEEITKQQEEITKQQEEITKQQEEITKQQEEITKQQEEITKQQEEPIVEETPTTIEESMSDTKTDQTVFDVAEKDKLLMERLDMIASLLEKQQQIIDTFQTKLNSLEEKRELKVFKPLSVTNEISLKDSLFKRV